MKISRKSVLGAAAIAAVLALSLVAPTSVGAAGPKTYVTSASPARLAIGSGQSASLTLTNTARNNIAFNAINIAVPASIAIGASPTVSTSTGAGTISYNAASSTIELRALNVGNKAPNNYVRVNLTITTDVTPNCASYAFTTDVRQSNNFNGTLNKFVLEGADPTLQAPCDNASVTCTAADQATCSTGTIYSGTGGTAEVTVEDSDTVTGTLTASLDAASYQCDEYVSSSDELFFDIDITNGVSTTGLTKTVTFSSPVPDAREAWEYQVCFKAPYDFPALLPSQLLQDFNTDDFSGNTQVDGAEFKGLLLPCSAGFGAPCVQDRAISSDRINITVSTPVADPRVRV